VLKLNVNDSFFVKNAAGRRSWRWTSSPTESSSPVPRASTSGQLSATPP